MSIINWLVFFYVNFYCYNFFGIIFIITFCFDVGKTHFILFSYCCCVLLFNNFFDLYFGWLLIFTHTRWLISHMSTCALRKGLLLRRTSRHWHTSFNLSVLAIGCGFLKVCMGCCWFLFFDSILTILAIWLSRTFIITCLRRGNRRIRIVMKIICFF